MPGKLGPSGLKSIITINVPIAYLTVINRYLEKGLYPSRSEMIRVAMRDFFVNEGKLQDKLDTLPDIPEPTVKVMKDSKKLIIDGREVNLVGVA